MITKGILISIKCKKKLYWSDYVNGNEVAKALYKIYANKLKQIIRLAKKLYFDKQLQSDQHYSRKTWKVLRELLPKKSNSSIPHEIYDSNGILTSNQEEITNQFNQYFEKIGKKLSNDVSCNFSLTTFLRIYKTQFLHQCFLRQQLPTKLIVLF